MNRIALFLPNWIGDVVMATPAIRAMHEHDPAAELIAVCKPYVADVIAGSPWIQHVILHDKNGTGDVRFWSAARSLRRLQPDAALLFPNSFRTALLARAGGCRRVIGFARYARGFLLSQRLTAKVDSRGRLVPTPIIDDYNRLALALGTQHPGYRMELFTSADNDAAAEAVWTQFRLDRHSRVIGLNPGAAFGSAKHWPIAHFAILAHRFASEGNTGVLVLCGPSEREMARQIAADSQHANVVSLADNPLSLGLSKAIVRKLDLLVTTDSGPRHFAAAFGTPVVTLFGPTHIEWTETYYEKAIHLQHQVPCGPCQLRVCPLDHRCMRDLQPDQVYDAASRLLAREVRRAG